MQLHIILKKKWFEMILSGEKKEDYRAINTYWQNKLKKPFSTVRAVNGYRADAKRLTWESRGWRVGKPNPLWCEAVDADKEHFILLIGDVKIIQK